jgi:hypothetical protein
MSCIFIHDDPHSTFTIINDSDYSIYEIYLTPVDTYDWGPNLLGRDILYSGESMTIDLLECDYYNVQIVDEYGLPCELLDDIYLCFDDEFWRITNYTLDACWE